MGILILGGHPTVSAQEAVSAQEIAPAELFSLLDQNRDGKLVTDEIPEGQYRFFERILRLGDKDQDGSISPEEFAAALNGDGMGQDRTSERMQNTKDRPQLLRRPFAVIRLLDQDENGTLNVAEWARAVQVFKQLDTDANGELSQWELIGIPDPAPGSERPGSERPGSERPGSERPGSERPGSERPGGERPGSERPGGERRGVPSGQSPGDGRLPREGEAQEGSSAGMTSVPGELFHRMDGNEDGWITPAEAPQRLRDSFAQIDTDKDGRLSFEEFRVGLLMLRQQRASQ